MAKKETENEDIFSGTSLSDEAGKDKQKKKAEKKAEKTKKRAAKIKQKREALEQDLKTYKAQIQSVTDEADRKALQKRIDSTKTKLDVLSGKKKGASAKSKKVLRTVITIVVIVALIVTYVGTGTVRKGFIHSTLQWTTGLTAVDIKTPDGDTIHIPVSTYNFYFAQLYNNISQQQQQYQQQGYTEDDYPESLQVDLDKKLSSQTTKDDSGKEVTWAQYMQEQVLLTLKNTYMYYNEAVKANDGKEPSITSDQKKEINDAVKQYKSTANSYGYTTSGYLVLALGKGVTESVFRRENKRSYIAQNYQEKLQKNNSNKKYTEKDYTNYKKNHADDLKAVSFRIFEAESEDDAKAFKKELKADGSNFTSLAVKYSKGSHNKAVYKQPEASTRLYANRLSLESAGYAITTAKDSVNTTESKYPGIDWLMSSDRKKGDIRQYSTSVVYVLSKASVPENDTVNVRHILIAPSVDDDTEVKDASNAAWKKAYNKAKKILDQYNSGKKTEDSFSSLAKKNSADEGSKDDGGLYENVVPGQMVTPFDSWIFDSSRKTGDTAIIRTDYGYHIMYFSGKTDTPVWKAVAQSVLTSSNSDSVSSELSDKYVATMNWYGKHYVEKDTDIDN